METYNTLKSRKLSNIFMKMSDIPIININDIEILIERLFLYNKQFDTITKLNLFEQDLLQIYKSGNNDDNNYEKAYFKYIYELINKIINHIKYMEDYEQLIIQKSLFKEYDKKYNNGDIYTSKNHKKKFISIDLYHSNYNSLKFYYSGLVDYTNSYKDFIKQFTQYEHLVNSKYFEQIIFSNLNPNQQIIISEYLTHKLINVLENYNEHYIDIISVNTNEIIIHDYNEYFYDYIEKEIYFAVDFLGIEINIKEFELFDNNIFYILRNINTNKYIFKKLNNEYYPFVLRLLRHESFKENDYMFMHNNTMCKYLSPPITKLYLE